MKYLLFLIATFVFFSCKRNEKLTEDNYITLRYAQTKCSDAWTTAATDSATILNVNNYLQTKSLYNSGVFIKQVDAGDTCTACICKTGKVIEIITLDSEVQKNKYATLGFK